MEARDNPTLPPEMLHAIFGFCDAPTVLNMRLVCHHFLLVVESKSFWLNTLILCPQSGPDVSAIGRLRVALHALRAEELRNTTRREIKRLIYGRPLAEYDYDALAGARTLQDANVVVGDHIRVTLRDRELDAIVVNTSDQPHQATIIIMTPGGHLERMPLGELTHYDVIFNRVAFYKGGRGYARHRHPSPYGHLHYSF